MNYEALAKELIANFEAEIARVKAKATKQPSCEAEAYCDDVIAEEKAKAYKKYIEDKSKEEPCDCGCSCCGDCDCDTMFDGLFDLVHDLREDVDTHDDVLDEVYRRMNALEDRIKALELVNPTSAPFNNTRLEWSNSTGPRVRIIKS